MNLPLAIEDAAVNSTTEPGTGQAQAGIRIRVLRQLLEALLSEGVLPYRRLSGTGPEDCRFRCDVGGHVWTFTGRVAAFGRMRIKPLSLVPYAEQLHALLHALPMAPEAFEKLQDELAQTLRFCHWNEEHLGPRLSRRALDFARLESVLDEGHPYHPCFKARTGFSADDHYRYGPEAQQVFRLHWLAVRREYLQQQLPDSEGRFWQQELGEPVYSTLMARLRQQTTDWQSYRLLPIHPWQWQSLMHSLLPPLFPSLLSDGKLLYLGEAGDDYRASQSVRTLLNASRPDSAHVKLPMNLVNTSSLRTLEPHSVCTAPVLCDWLQRVVDADTFFREQQGLVLLPEYAGLLFEDARYPQLHGQLAAIWRANVNDFLGDDETAVPFTALLAVEADGRPFIDPWIAQQGLENWLDRLLQVTVLPIWHLLVGQGIAVEAHAQNLILLHTDGYPSRIAVRDFHESVEYVPDYLAQPELCPDFLPLNPRYAGAGPDEFYWMEGVEALRELYMDSLYIYNLSELAHLLHSHYGFAEQNFWQRIAELLQRYREAGFTPACRIDALGAEAQQIKTESLVRRKLRYPQQAECHHWIANPLAAGCP